jgi:hypothetical protein
VLSDELVPAFPEFRAGDLLFSFCTIHLVAVLGPEDITIKWWSHGPWRFQHNPDFTVNGKILVFSNNTGGGRSEIIRMDPATRDVQRPVLLHLPLILDIGINGSMNQQFFTNTRHFSVLMIA